MSDADSLGVGELPSSPAHAGAFVRTLLLGLSGSRAAWFARLLRRHGHFAHVVEDSDGRMDDLPSDVNLVIIEIDGSEQSLIRCKAVRTSYNIALIGISGVDTEQERLRVLGAGCDEHLYWDCGPAEVMARIDAVLRWVGPTLARQPVVGYGPVRLTPATREAWLEGKAIHLTHKEYELVRMLVEQEGQVAKRGDILQTIWGEQSQVASRSLDTHVSSLRRKFGRWICLTVRGYGLRMGAPGVVGEAP